MKTILGLLLSVFVLASCASEKSDAENPSDKDNPITSDIIDNKNSLDTSVANAEGPKITFAKYEHDFGELEEGMEVTHDFQFTNTGSKDLIISQADGSCGCTVPNFPKYPIAPGVTESIKVKFNSTNKGSEEGKLNTQTVTVYTNTTPSETKLTITAKVVK